MYNVSSDKVLDKLLENGLLCSELEMLNFVTFQGI